MRLRYVFALFCVSSCRCADLPGDLIYACGPGGECPAGSSCSDAGFCEKLDAGEPPDAGPPDSGCQPTRMCSGEECGVVGDDGCGGLLDCGECQEPFRCNLLVPNRCGCIPFDAGVQVCPQTDAGAVVCGSLTVDNCGTTETFVCGGGCPMGLQCHDNLCCVPPSDAELCASAQFGCGAGVSVDRCGTLRHLDCGQCAVGNTCVFDDVGSHCAVAMCTPETDGEMCNRLGANCGVLVGTDNCGTPNRSADCAAPCDAGSCTSTQPNQCECQPALAGCTSAAQCCAGLDCGKPGQCCVLPSMPCADDGECCSRLCQLGACCSGVGSACGLDVECCSGLCGPDGGCEYVDAGSAWDGGEL